MLALLSECLQGKVSHVILFKHPKLHLRGHLKLLDGDVYVWQIWDSLRHTPPPLPSDNLLFMLMQNKITSTNLKSRPISAHQNHCVNLH